MPIVVSCKSCDAKFAVKNDLAGRRIRCIQCKSVLEVDAPPQTPVNRAEPGRIAAKAVTGGAKTQPSSQSTPVPETQPPEVPEDYEVLRAKIMAGFERPAIERIPVAMSYRLGIVLAAFFMMLLPVIYMCLIAVAAWGVYYHAVHHVTWISSAASSGSGRNAGRAAVMAFMVYMAPIIAGATMVLFMLKPLLSKPANDGGRRSLNPDDEPLLFDFVDRICDAVRAPKPQRIDIDCNINASAGFGGGVLSFFGNNLVLTIGMPLVAGLDIRQFAGVLAHEFGHFAQGIGMRLTYLTRSISYWFTRVVYERDAWDERLEKWSGELDLRIGWIFYLTRLAVWLTRRILWVLMMTGHAVSGYMLRQMEFDADRYEARLAGSRTFARTARQLSILNVAHNGAMSDLGNFYSEGRLGDNLPRLILVNVDEMPRKIFSEIDRVIAESRTGFLDTHPADHERIANAEREKTNGIFRLNYPAAALFRRFDFHSRAVTWDFYREIFGNELKRDEIHPVDELVHRQKVQLQNFKAHRRFFQGSTVWYRPFPTLPTGDAASMDAGSLLNRLKEGRSLMLRMAGRYQSACRKHGEAESRRIQADIADRLLSTGNRIKKDDFSIPLTSRREIDAALDDVEAQQESLEETLSRFEEAAAARLYGALKLCGSSRIAGRTAAAGFDPAETSGMLATFSRLNRSLPQIQSIHDGHLVLGQLLMVATKNSDNTPLVQHIQDLMKQLSDEINSLHESLQKMKYPFDHARADISVAEFVLKELPDPTDPGEIYSAAESIGENLPLLQIRVMGRLCQVAECVESAIGLPRLEDPPEPDEE